VASRVERMESRIEHVDARITHVEDRLDRLNEKVQTLELTVAHRFDQVDAKLDQLLKAGK
jgi:uncharacterized coiled-coil protein SlyX